MKETLDIMHINIGQNTPLNQEHPRNNHFRVFQEISLKGIANNMSIGLNNWESINPITRKYANKSQKLKYRFSSFKILTGFQSDGGYCGYCGL